MRTELQQTLTEKYPKIFQVIESQRLMPYAMFGIECGDGWYNIINALCFQIQNHIDWNNSQRKRLLENNLYNVSIPDEISQVTVSQVKEKYGDLRFYYEGGDSKIDGMVRMAEAMSAVTCEVCGDVGKMRGHGWYYTACDKHAREEDLVAENREDTHGPE